MKEGIVDTVIDFAGGVGLHRYCFNEVLADGAVLGGMNRKEALQMAARTCIGAAKMVEETRKHPGQLKDDVCSGGGSTINGIRILEKNGMRGTVIEAVKAASERSKELGKILSHEEIK